MLTTSAARLHFSLAISSMVPCISGTSTAWLSTSTTLPKIALTSASLFLLPVMKFNFRGADAMVDNSVTTLVDWTVRDLSGRRGCCGGIVGCCVKHPAEALAEAQSLDTSDIL